MKVTLFYSAECFLSSSIVGNHEVKKGFEEESASYCISAVLSGGWGLEEVMAIVMYDGEQEVCRRYIGGFKDKVSREEATTRLTEILKEMISSHEAANEFMNRMKTLTKVMEVNKEKYGHDKMALEIDDFIKLVDVADQADDKTYFVVLVESKQPMIVAVRKRKDRPQQIDTHTVLERWITSNYNFRKYDYWDVSDKLNRTVIE